MSVGHRSHRLEGGRAIHTAFIKRRRAPTTQLPVAPHHTYWEDWPQLARAIARPDIWALTPSMAMRRL
jgi:hypothetical protein